MITSIIDRSTLDQQFDFQQGTMILVDKPKEWTSFDIVNKIRGKLRYHLNTKKIKVGHAGTLDPMATGLLVVCTGKYTKEIDSIQGQDKCYTSTLHLGATTPSFDAESAVDQTYPIDHITAAEVDRVCHTYLGHSEQIPPMFSAIKIDGQALYKLARKGKTIARPPRPITIHSLDVLSLEPDALTIRVVCSKGTYIRTLAYDIGRDLGSGAYLTALRRDKIGAYDVQQALAIDELVEWIETNKAFAPNN